MTARVGVVSICGISEMSRQGKKSDKGKVNGFIKSTSASSMNKRFPAGANATDVALFKAERRLLKCC
jgi:hypothetical protein